MHIRNHDYGWQAIAVAFGAILLLIVALIFGAQWILGGAESDIDGEATVAALFTPSPEPTALPSGATLVLGPPAGAPGETVTVTGAGFPPDSPITLQIGSATGGTPQAFAEVTADAMGTIIHPFEVPATYPDGSAITDTQLVIVAVTADGAVSASATMDFNPMPPVEGTSEPAETGGEATLAPTDNGTFAVYVSDVLSVTFQYPADWVSTAPDTYEGATGYFTVTAAGTEGTTLEALCDLEMNDGMLTYGTAPTVQYIDVAGMPACVITASADQGAEMRGQAALIVTYPVPVVVDGQTYLYLVLRADQAHIIDPLSTTLAFLTQP